ncbi:MAG: TetR/AcrR family transcriptional regulator [Phenylobacterium sp.]
MGIFDLLWTPAAGAKRGPRPSLTREGIVQAAITLADREGLEAVTMQRLAAVLNSKTMTLYRYAPSKDAILELMWDAAMGDPPDVAEGGWRARLSAWGDGVRQRLDQHPWLIELVGATRSVGPRWTAWLDVGLAALSGLPLSAGEGLAVLTLVDGHLRSTARLRFGAKASPEWAADFGRMLQITAADSRFPFLGEMTRRGDFAASGMSMDQISDFGLARILDGVATFCESRTPGRPDDDRTG